MKAVIQEWLISKMGRRKEIEFLVGLLHEAAKIVCTGQRFVGRITVLMTSV